MSNELDALRSDMRQRLRSLIEFPLDKAQPALTAEMLEMFVRAIIADPIPKDGDATTTDKIAALKARIAELERERDELRERCVALANNRITQRDEAIASAARLRKAGEEALSALDGFEPLTARRILTAALQPEPGTDPQPARGEDSPVSAPDLSGGIVR